MIVVKTPFRVSFLGGGTDFPDYYHQFGGAVLSTTIDKYCYISCKYLPPFFDFKYRLRYFKEERVTNLSDINHHVIREVFRAYGLVDVGVDLAHFGDIPAQSGIGSSSAFTVGCLLAIRKLMGHSSSKFGLAKEAVHFEQNILKEYVGSQDQIASAYGGFNHITFSINGEFNVEPVQIEPEKINHLDDNLMLFFTGISRNSQSIIKDQQSRLANNYSILKEKKALVSEGLDILRGKISKYDDFGALLHEGWRRKRELSSMISSSFIDEMYEKARNAGALGGKVTGAGGGGFLLLYVPKNKQNSVREELKELMHIPFKFEKNGASFLSGDGLEDTEIKEPVYLVN